MEHFNMSQSNLNNNTAELISTAGLFLNLVVVLPENIYVIWLIITGAGNGVASEFLSLNLSICEILLCVQCFLLLLISAFPSLLLVLAFLNGIPATGRPLFQCLICVERYLAVVHPVTFLKYKPVRYKVICCAVAWIIIVIDCVLIMLGLMNMFEFICYAVCQGMLTLSIKLFCCLAVLRTLKQSGPGEKGRERENNMKKRAFKNILLIMMAIVFIYAAYVVAAIVFIQTNQFVNMLWTAGQVCFWLGGLVQPLLYLHRIRKLPFCKSS